MGIGFFMSWIITLTSALALVICIREIMAIAIDVWEARRLKSLNHWLRGSESSLEAYLEDDETDLHRHFAVMSGLGFVAALGTVFGFLTLGF